MRVANFSGHIVRSRWFHTCRSIHAQKILRARERRNNHVLVRWKILKNAQWLSALERPTAENDRSQPSRRAPQKNLRDCVCLCGFLVRANFVATNKLPRFSLQITSRIKRKIESAPPVVQPFSYQPFTHGLHSSFPHHRSPYDRNDVPTDVVNADYERDENLFFVHN